MGTSAPEEGPVVYRIAFRDGEGAIEIEPGAPRAITLPDARAFDVLPVQLSIRDKGATHERTAEYGLRTGALVRIGDLTTRGAGSEQYSARTSQWAGDPRGHLEPFRCVGGVFLPAILQDGATVRLGELAWWERETGAILAEGGPRLGELRLDDERPWPRHATWTNATGETCTLERRGEPSAPFALPPSAEVREPASAAPREPFRDVPPLGDLDLPLSLAEADRIARRDPQVSVFLSQRPGSWLVQAEHRPWGGGLLNETRWTLIYGDPEDGARIVTEINGAGSTARPRGPAAPFPPAFVPPRIWAGDALVPAAAVAGAAASHSGLDLDAAFSVSWFSATAPDQQGTNDAAVWELGWTTAEGRATLTVSAVDGRALAKVVGMPQFV